MTQQNKAGSGEIQEEPRRQEQAQYFSRKRKLTVMGMTYAQ
jgi:hypothetical protein